MLIWIDVFGRERGSENALSTVVRVAEICIIPVYWFTGLLFTAMLLKKSAVNSNQ